MQKILPLKEIHNQTDMKNLSKLISSPENSYEICKDNLP